MHSPLSPSPSSLASSARQPVANERMDHMTHYGSAEAGAPAAPRQRNASVTFKPHDPALSDWGTPHQLSQCASTSIVGWEGSSQDNLLKHSAANCSNHADAHMNGPDADVAAYRPYDNVDAERDYGMEHFNKPTPDEVLSGLNPDLPPSSLASNGWTNGVTGTRVLDQTNNYPITGGFNPFISGTIPESIHGPPNYSSNPIDYPLYGNQDDGTFITYPSIQPSANLPWAPSMVNVIPRTPCPWIGCSESFARFTDIQRHWDSVHLGIKYHCFWIGCPNNGGKGYCRLEKLRTHQRQKHGFALV